MGIYRRLVVQMIGMHSCFVAMILLPTKWFYWLNFLKFIPIKIQSCCIIENSHAQQATNFSTLCMSQEN